MKRIRNAIYYIVGLIVFILAIMTIFDDFINESHAIITDNTVSNKMVIHYLDVGQGDATFIELPDGKSLLLDAGEYKYEKRVENYIRNLGYSKIDYIIGTHPHSDHIGSLYYIINHFDVGKVYFPRINSSTKTYEYFLKAVNNKNLKIKVAKAGVSVQNYDNFKIYFISPTKDYYEEENNYSAVLKIDYNNKSFLFMADAEKLVEDEIKVDIKANAVRVGHHGSFSSSSIGFVNRVKADYAIISVGDNDYNLPRKEIINRWQNSGATVYRTDKNGNIKLTTNGIRIKVETER